VQLYNSTETAFTAAACSFCDKNVTSYGNFPILGKILRLSAILRLFVHELFIMPWYTFTIFIKKTGILRPFLPSGYRRCGAVFAEKKGTHT
jgi:hypothetical protein